MSVLLDPLVKTLLEFVISGVDVSAVTLPLEREWCTASSVAHVVEVSDDVETEGSCVASGAGDTRAGSEIAKTIVGVGRATSGKPDLRRCSAVAEEEWRETWHRVVGVSDTVLNTAGAVHVVGENIVTNTRRTEGVQVARNASTTEVGSGKDSDGTAERVTGNDELVALVLIQSSLDKAHGIAGNLVPGIREALVNLGARGKVAVLPGEDDIGDEVADVVATTDGQNNLTSSVVNGNIRRNASPATLGIAYSIDSVALNIGTWSTALDGVSTAWVEVAVSSSRMLDVELEVLEGGLADSISGLKSTGVLLETNWTAYRQSGKRKDCPGQHLGTKRHGERYADEVDEIGAMRTWMVLRYTAESGWFIYCVSGKEA